MHRLNPEPVSTMHVDYIDPGPRTFHANKRVTLLCCDVGLTSAIHSLPQFFRVYSAVVILYIRLYVTDSCSCLCCACKEQYSIVQYIRVHTVQYDANGSRGFFLFTDRGICKEHGVQYIATYILLLLL